jgi:hypothetical protein
MNILVGMTMSAKGIEMLMPIAAPVERLFLGDADLSFRVEAGPANVELDHPILILL